MCRSFLKISTEKGILVKRVPVIMPYVVQFLSDLLNIHCRRCLQTLLRQRELWESRQQQNRHFTQECKGIATCNFHIYESNLCEIWYKKSQHNVV